MTHDELSRHFQELMEKHKGILFKVARMYCRDEEDRKDLIQEMMIQVWRSIAKYNNKFAVSTWLYKISLNVAISFYRKNIVRQKAASLMNEQFFVTDEVASETKLS